MQWPITNSKWLTVILMQPVMLNLTTVLHSICEMSCLVAKLAGMNFSYLFLKGEGWAHAPDLCTCNGKMKMPVALSLPRSLLASLRTNYVHIFWEPGLLVPNCVMEFGLASCRVIIQWWLLRYSWCTLGVTRPGVTRGVPISHYYSGHWLG